MHTDRNNDSAMVNPVSTGADADIFSALAARLSPLIEKPLDEAAVRKIVADEVDTLAPRKLEVSFARLDVPEPTTCDDRHGQFAELLELIGEGHPNLMLVGPAGSGKTTLAAQVAETLGLQFRFLSLSAGVTETHVFGRMVPTTTGGFEYRESAFVKVYREGGVFLFDEIDAADANVMVAVNAALANGELSNPITGECVKRHESCIILAAANTWGTGADTQYVGRNALDAATLDRFVLAMLLVTYDASLEARIFGVKAQPKAERKTTGKPATGEEVQAWFNELRAKVAAARLRRVVSTRLAVAAMRAARAGRSLDEIKARLFAGWSADERAKIGYYN